VTDAALHRLHERTRLWALTLMLALICYSIPYMYSIFLVLYTVGVASVFYPSERVLRIRNEANSSCWDSICSSYHKKELKNKFKEFLTPRPV
jgi:hypothetical protein